jgi:hypothetical protein
VETFLTVAAVGAAVVVLAWLLRHESHWVNDDGTRFTCLVLDVSSTGAAPPAGADRKWRPARAVVIDRRVTLVRLGVGLGGPLDYEVTAEAPEPPRRSAVFLLADTVAVKVPRRSRAAGTLRALLAQPSA